MKSNEFPQLKTQITIVKKLLDGSKKSQRKIAEEIGKEESTVFRALEYLKDVVEYEEKEIESGKRNKGIYKNKLRYINFEKSNIIYFFNKVLNLKTLNQQDEADIISSLQKSELFIETLSKNSICGWLLQSPELESEDLREMLRFSPTFFKLIIKNEPENMNKIVTRLCLGTTEWGIAMVNTNEELENLKKLHPEKEADLKNLKHIGYWFFSRSNLRDEFFKWCVRIDYLQTGLMKDEDKHPAIGKIAAAETYKAQIKPKIKVAISQSFSALLDSIKPQQ
ncbi:MAG: hypothetical protein WA130_07050 [Candidatus Methanoperedens sp.]